MLAAGKALNTWMEYTETQLLKLENMQQAMVRLVQQAVVKALSWWGSWAGARVAAALQTRLVEVKKEQVEIMIHRP